MKNYLKTFWAAALIVVTAVSAIAQNISNHQFALGPIEPYKIEVTYDKTSHLIFPSAVRYVDLGSDYVTAGKAEDAENVLRVKAAVRDFETETNFSVITEDGRFYSFDVFYNSCPSILSYNLVSSNRLADKATGQDVFFEELGNNSPSLTDLLLENIYKKGKKNVNHIGTRSFGIQFILKGIYIHNDKYYFHTQVTNRTNVPFAIDYVNFRIMDKRIAKRTVIQENSLVPLRSYRPLGLIAGKTAEQNVFLLNQFTISDDKVLLIEMYERNGGRHQTLQVEDSDLIKARTISDMHLKF